jgi:hypothetical protein
MDWLEDQKRQIQEELLEMRRLYKSIPKQRSLKASLQGKHCCALSNWRVTKSQLEMFRSSLQVKMAGINPFALAERRRLSGEAKPELDRLWAEVNKAQNELDRIDEEYGLLDLPLRKIREQTGNLRPLMIILHKVQEREEARFPKKTTEDDPIVPFSMSSLRPHGFGSGYDEIRLKIEHSTQGIPEVQDDRRGPPRDRPPDKPPPWKGAVVGSSLERAGSRHDQRASSSSCDANGVSGNASSMQTMHLRIKSPSYRSHSSQATGTSLKISAQTGGARVATGLGLNGIRVWHSVTLPQI